MSIPLVIAFLFSAGALIGWCIEFLFRNLISHKGPRGKYFINPGFCSGPYLPIYGIGLTVMFLITYAVTKNGVKGDFWSDVLVILAIMAAMTVIEFIGGLFLLKVMNLRLWDYRNQPGNFMGIVCPLFTLIWGAIGAAYYLLIHPAVINALIWLSQNLAFSFCIGLFYGVFIIDLVTVVQKAILIKQFGDDNEVVVKYEQLKELVQKKRLEAEQKVKFFNQVVMDNSNVVSSLKEHAESLEGKAEAFKSKVQKKIKKNK